MITKSNVIVGNVFVDMRRISTIVDNHGEFVRIRGIEYVSN